MEQRLSNALVQAGLAQAVLHQASEDGVATVLIRPAGATAREKEERMAALAQEVLSKAPGQILIARQYLVLGGKFGHAWNISVFGEEALSEVEHVLAVGSRELTAGPSRAGVAPASVRAPARPAAPAGPGQQIRKVVYQRGKNKIEEMILPHVGRGRNQYKVDPTAPLRIGKGATPVLELQRVQTGGNR